jgi:hypothetical protein
LTFWPQCRFWSYAQQCIDKIRAEYNSHLKDKEMMVRQRATALYLIDKLALRVGNEKDTEEEADTVGCCSLRVEHVEVRTRATSGEFFLIGYQPLCFFVTDTVVLMVQLFTFVWLCQRTASLQFFVGCIRGIMELLHGHNGFGLQVEEPDQVSFDFLGKDSIRYCNTVTVEPQVFKNIKIFMKNKEPQHMIFDRLTVRAYIRSAFALGILRRPLCDINKLQTVPRASLNRLACVAAGAVAQQVPPGADGGPHGQGLPHIQRVYHVATGAGQADPEP